MCDIPRPTFVTIANTAILVSTELYKIFQVTEAGNSILHLLSPLLLHLSLSVFTSILLTHRSLTHPTFQGKRVYFNSMPKVEKRRNTSSTTTTWVALYWMRRPTLVSLSRGISGEPTTLLKRLNFNISLMSFCLFFLWMACWSSFLLWVILARDRLFFVCLFC